MNGETFDELQQRAGLMTTAEATLAAHRRCDELEQVVQRQGVQLRDLVVVIGLAVLALAVVAAVVMQRLEKKAPLA